jgi:hypothetical protein
MCIEAAGRFVTAKGGSWPKEPVSRQIRPSARRRGSRLSTLSLCSHTMRPDCVDPFR